MYVNYRTKTLLKIKFLNLLCLHSKFKIPTFEIPYKLLNEASRNDRLFLKSDLAEHRQ
jgi:hypothetical protein